MKIDIHSERWERACYEAVFWLLLILTVVGIVAGMMLQSYWLLGISVASFFIGWWSGFIEPFLITVARYRLPLLKEPKTWVRVVFLSDLHAGLYKDRSFYDRVAEKTQALSPDLILIGGDLVEETADPLPELEPLAKLQAPLGKFFILGNHDYIDHPDAVHRQLVKWGFEPLINEQRVLKKDERAMEIVGLDDSWLGKSDAHLLRRADHLPRLLLVHEPDNLLDVTAQDAEAIVMGHTHGGQVRLPFIGALRRLPQTVSQKYDRGLRDWLGIPVVISQGIGESITRVRLCCPPQIVILELGI